MTGTLPTPTSQELTPDQLARACHECHGAETQEAGKAGFLKVFGAQERTRTSTELPAST